MGLYDHTGDLLINGHPAEAFPAKQLHAHTTCCFQDHGKYRLTLRENIGIGNVDLMDSEIAIEEAIVRGGAEPIKDKLGLEARLCETGIPETRNDYATTAGPDAAGASSDVKRPGSTSLRFRGAGKGTTSTDEGVKEDVKDDKKVSGLQQMSLSGGQWQRVALARAFMRTDEADLVVFE